MGVVGPLVFHIEEEPVEEEFDRSGLESSDPSDDEFDRLIAETKKAAEREVIRNSGSEPEEEDDEEKDEDTTDDDAPGNGDFDDDYDADEANTPEDGEEEVVAKPLESRKKNAVTQQGSDDEDDLANTSRKKRGKIIEQYRKELEESEAEKKRLAEQLATQKAEEDALTEEVNRALGTDTEYEKAVEDGLSGDEDAAERAKVWKANRAFYRKLVKSAGKTYQEEFAQHYWDTVRELPGVDLEIVAQKDLATIIQHVHEAGQSEAEKQLRDKVTELQKQVTTPRGRVKSSGPKQASNERRSPITGGGETVQPKNFDYKKVYYDSDGLPTDEFESLIRRHGFEAVASGKFYKRGK